MTIRLAVVQHGDFLQARRAVAAGSESYFGMTHSVQVLDRLLAGHPHLVVSLNAPAGDAMEGDGRYVGCPAPAGGRLPWQVTAWRWAGRIIAELERFRPTHLLTRIGGVTAARILGWADRRQVPTLAVFHGYLSTGTVRDRLTNRWLAHRLNRPHVARAANHRRPAANSLIRAGVDSAKVAAFDWPGQRRPHDFPARTDFNAESPELFYCGTLDRLKGVIDLVEAVGLLRRQGLAVRATLAGDGPDRKELQQAIDRLPPGAVRLIGQVPNAEVFTRMRAADVVVVPSHHGFSEGFPKALTEGLASRTPVVCSDHPVFVEALRGSEGVRWFRAADPASLAAAVGELIGDPALYRRTSDAGIEAYERDDSPLMFGDLIDEWAAGMK